MSRGYRYGDAHKNGQELDQRNQPFFEKRRSTKLSGDDNQHNDPIFRLFTRESLDAQKQRGSKNGLAELNRQKLGPDPCLASGQQLPLTLIRQMPPNLIGKPIEDVDPYYRNQGTFVIISRSKELIRFSANKSLYIFDPFHPIRKTVLYILVNSIFNLLVILTILTNCILMTFQGSEMIENTEVIFTIVYTTEMGLKVLAKGFVLDEFTYLRDAWNWLDFVVIIMAYLTIVIEDLGNLSVMRTFRVLRALKTVAIIPGMKTIVGAVIDSVKNLKDVVVLTLFSLSVFSLSGLQIYMGQLTQKCILDGPNNMTDAEWFDWCNNSSHWVADPNSEIFGAFRLCGNATGAQSCPKYHTCLQGFGPNPDYGFTSFDTFGWSLICSFRLMTQDFWEGLYMQILKTAGSWHIIYFLISIFLGSIYLMNLILAIVAMSYNELQRQAEEEEEAAAEDEANFLDSCRIMVKDKVSDLSHSSTSQARSSYRPSTEVGHIGESILGSLYQDGISGRQILKKHDQQLMMRNQNPQCHQFDYIMRQSARSHSLCVGFGNQTQQSLDHQAPFSDHLSASAYYPNLISDHRESILFLSPRLDSRIASESGVSKFVEEQKQESSIISMNENKKFVNSRRQSPGSICKPQLPKCKICQTNLIIDSENGNLIKGKLASSSHEWVSRKTIQKISNKIKRTLSTSLGSSLDRDLKMFKERAAQERIVSHNQTPIIDMSLHDGQRIINDDIVRTFSTDSKDIHHRGHCRFHKKPSGSSTHSIDNLLFRSRRKRSPCKDEEINTRQDLKCAHLSSSRAVGYCSDMAICKQPLSIHRNFSIPVKDIESSQPTRQLSLSNSTGKNLDHNFFLDRHQMNQWSNFGGSAGTILNDLIKSKANEGHKGSVGSDRLQLESRNLHHLSVENFQEFKRNHTKYSNPEGHRFDLNPRESYNSRASSICSSQCSSQKSGLSHHINHRHQQSRGHHRDCSSHIHPSVMLESFGKARQSVAILGQIKQGSSMADRRLSKDFNRLASDWSRLSMSTNVDLRRLLRLWSHTNPYSHGSPSFTSVANSQVDYGYENENRFSLNDKRASDHELSRAQSMTSHRPSHTGSTLHTYELISAISRRRNLYGSAARYSTTRDDDLESNMSINIRDKCLAYCLSGLDVVCIWECCDPWLKIQSSISIIVFDPFTELFIILCIVINTLFMALDSDDADEQMRSIFERGNYFFTATFAVEASMKIMALSPKFYFREGWNLFDSFIVGLSLLEVGLEGVYGLSVLRSFRLLRVFKLAKSWPTLNLLISIMGKTVGDLGNLTFVLAIIVFIFAVMGMQLFGNKYIDRNFPSGELPRWNFTDFMHSFMIVFRILCAEWIEPMWDCLLVSGWPCIPFFLIAVIVGNLVVLNLFLALLLASFGASNLSSPQSDNVDTKKLKEAIGRFTRFAKWFKKKFIKLAGWSRRKMLFENANHLEKTRDLQTSQSPGDSDRPIKSHIVTMTRLERLRNIELKTNELRSKIRKSPEHHYHLKQLAVSHSYAARSPVKTKGLNFDYKNRTNTGAKKYNKGVENFLDTAGNSRSRLTVIPIIVDEPNDFAPNLDSFLTTSSGTRAAPAIDSMGSIIGSENQIIKDETRLPTTPIVHEDSNLDRTDQPIEEDLMYSSSSLFEPNLGTVSSLSAQHPSDGRGLGVDMSLINTSLSHKQDYKTYNRTEVRDESDSLHLEATTIPEMEEEDEKTLQHIESCIENCICLGILFLNWFLFRQHIRKIVEHPYFEQCVLILIIISSGTLALEDKHLSERPTLKQTLDLLDTIFTIIFSLEMFFKWLAFGIRRYFNNIWSWLDFFIVLVSLMNLMASLFGAGKIQALKTMRTLRAMRGLRPLRALQRFQGMRIVVNALIQAIPSIFNVLLVCLIFWLIFSIMGVQMFGGKFWRCLDPKTREVVSYELAGNRFECLERNFTWSNPQINFDNVLNAYLALFQVATFHGWIDIMNSATDSRSRDDQPIREANIYMYFYFVFFVIFGSFFTLNLFIGVIIDNFNEQKKKTGGSFEIFMTEDQKKYYHAMKKMKSKRPVKAMTRPKMKLQALMFDITTSKKFDMVIMIIIGLNMFVMALEHYGQSHEFSLILESFNLVFIAIFTLECLCKIFAMRQFYFREPWNIFDFIVVDLSILGVVMKEYVAKYFVSPTLLRVVRVVKVGRVLRLVKGAKGIRTLLFALAMSLPALFNICLLLFLVMFIYAIFGMSFFMNVRPRSGIDETFNFETFASSFIVLFQVSTSAGWDLVLDPLMDEENDCQKPDPALGIEGTCGNKAIAIFYLISYVIVTFLIIINMYIAVILENYSQAAEDVQEGLTDDDYEMYYEIWQKFDPNGTQYLPLAKLSDFVDALEDPLRIAKPNDLALAAMDINVYEGQQCYCVDILDALTKFFFMLKGRDIQVDEHLQKVQSTLHESPFVRITTTYMIKREHYCARLIQNYWRKWRERAKLSESADISLADE